MNRIMLEEDKKEYKAIRDWKVWVVILTVVGALLYALTNFYLVVDPSTTQLVVAASVVGIAVLFMYCCVGIANERFKRERLNIGRKLPRTKKEL